MKAVLLLCFLVFLNIPVTSSSIFGCLYCVKKQEKNSLETLQILLGKGTEAITLDILRDGWQAPGFETCTSIGYKENGEKYEVKESLDMYRQGAIYGAQVIPKDSCRVGLHNFKNNVIINDLEDKDAR